MMTQIGNHSNMGIVPYHQFQWEKSSSQVLWTFRSIELKFDVLPEYEMWLLSYTQRRVQSHTNSTLTESGVFQILSSYPEKKKFKEHNFHL